MAPTNKCYCCDAQTTDYAWCEACGPSLEYRGDLQFYCPIHRTTTVVGLIEAKRQGRVKK